MQSKSQERSERLLDLFHQYSFLSSSQVQFLTKRPRRTANWFITAHLEKPGFVRRIKTPMGEDDAFTLTRFKEKSLNTLPHDLEISWQMIFAKGQADAAELEVLALSRDEEMIQIPTSKRPYTPDFFLALKGENAKGEKRSNFYFFEVTKSRPGTHFEKKDLIEKCERFNQFFDEGQFPDWLKKGFGCPGENFRVIYTFPTQDRAQNFVQTLSQEDFRHKGRFFSTWETPLRENFYGSVLYSPKDFSTLHSIAKHFYT